MVQQKNNLTPRKIAEELDKHIVGQHNAKKTLAIALRNRWRRQQADQAIQEEIMPSNIILIGSTGTGKTECARRMAKITDAPFVKVEATQYTERGYVGSEVKSMVNLLVEQSLQLLKKEKMDHISHQASHNVEQTILDELMQKTSHIGTSYEAEGGTLNASYQEQNRANLLQQLRKGALDEEKINIEIEENHAIPIGFVGGGQDMAAEGMMQNLQDMMKKFLPSKKKQRTLKVGKAIEFLLEQEKEKLLADQMESLKEEACRRAERDGIIFIDEIDKLASSNHIEGPDVSREGVQRDLLPIVEGTSVQTKYGNIKTDHILFIAAGAFHQTRPSDLIPELQGRFPIRVELDNLTQQDFLRILREPKNSLIKQYQAIFQAEQVELSLEEGAIAKIAEIAFHVNQEIEDIGARRLHTLLSQLFQDYLFDLPESTPSQKKITITTQYVQEKLADLANQKQKSHYIL